MTYPFEVVLIIAAAIGARCFAFFTTSIDADEGVYLVMAQRWLHGELPYVAVWDQHPPGLAALLAITGSVIADPVLGARLAAAAAVACTALLIHRFCVVYAAKPVIGIVAALLYILCISRWAGLSANTEVFNNAIVSLGAYLLFGAARHPPDLPRAACAALVLGIGLQIKYVVFPEAVLLSLGYLFADYAQRRSLGETTRAALLMMTLGCLPTAGVGAYFWHRGVLQAFLDANIASNFTYVSLVPPLSEGLRDSASGMLPIAGSVLVIAVAAIRGWPVRPYSPVPAVNAWVVLWIIAATVDVCLPMKFFRHYFFALYPPVCLGSSLALSWLSRGSSRRLAYGCAVLLVGALPVWALGILRAAPWSGEDVPRTIAGIVKAAKVGNGDLYVYRYQPTLYALADIRPPTPYVMSLELVEFSESAHVDGLAEGRRIMQGKPRFVVKQAGAIGGQAAPFEAMLEQALTNYRLIHRFYDRADRSEVEMYERLDDAATK